MNFVPIACTVGRPLPAPAAAPGLSTDVVVVQRRQEAPRPPHVPQDDPPVRPARGKEVLPPVGPPEEGRGRMEEYCMTGNRRF